MSKYIITWVILPKNEVGWGGFRCDDPAAPLAFKLRWSKNNKVDALDSQ